MSERPSVDAWLSEAKAHESAPKCGMYLVHNGTVRTTPRAKVREGLDVYCEVKALEFSFDFGKLSDIISDTYKLEGIYYVRVWLNEGILKAGEDIMYVLVGGDIRPRVVDAVQYIVGRIKNECVIEKELYE